MKTLVAAFVPVVLLLGCGGKVVFLGGEGGSGVEPTCGDQICSDSNQCCCGICQTPDLPCDESCPEPVCEGPYHVIDPDGDCVWSCGEGTQPDTASNECVCQPGLVEVGGVDELGRRLCGAP